MDELFDQSPQAQQKRDSLAREGLAAMRFIRLGYKPFALGEDEIRDKLGYKDKSKCADMVFYGRRPEVALIIEQKRERDTKHAIEQLRNTALHARKQFSIVEPVLIFSWLSVPSVVSVPLSDGYFAIRNRVGAYTLVDLLKRPITVDAGEEILVVFGP